MSSFLNREAEQFYSKYADRVREARGYHGRPLTYAEKVIFSHIARWPEQKPVRGSTTLFFRPDRIAMQDATAQMAVLQFSVTGRRNAAVPVTIHCDHLIRAEEGAGPDLGRARSENREVYDFLATAAKRYGMGFWGPGSGIIHQVVLEQYAFPGGMMLGTDSHTPNAGGLGMIAIGVGGADAVEVMADAPWGLMNPKLVGIKLTGKLGGWAAPKDVILKVAGLLTVKGGTGRIIEYFGPGTENISATGKATITNMGAELGATTSIFPFDARMDAYLKATAREGVAAWAQRFAADLRADPEVEAEPLKYFDEVYEIDLGRLEPQWVGPHTPDLLREVSAMKEAISVEGYPEDIRYALIGSCTNSSYEDMTRAASIARQAAERGMKTKIPLLVTPGSEQVFRTVERDGLLGVFARVGATVLANACGPCIGQWKRNDIQSGQVNTIVTSYNRNFRKRNDGNVETMAFMSSPEVVTAMAFSGRLSFNPLRDSLTDKDGREFRFSAPEGLELPSAGYVFSTEGFVPPPEDEEERARVRIAVSPDSERLALLEPFEAWNGKDLDGLLVLLKAQGKCTTDHISQAGPWLKYRGHLARISDNCFLGAVNAFTGEAGTGKNVLTDECGLPFPEIAKCYKSRGRSWVVFGEENYGEGSSREHAAMSPRFLGCRAVVVKSFARIHETNLKKQGILPLCFVNPADYDRIEEYDVVTIRLSHLKPGSPVTVELQKKSGESVEILTVHSMTEVEIGWFEAGSALNMLGRQGAHYEQGKSPSLREKSVSPAA